MADRSTKPQHKAQSGKSWKRVVAEFAIHKALRELLICVGQSEKVRDVVHGFFSFFAG